MRYIFLAFAGATLLFSCKKMEPSDFERFEFKAPSHFPEVQYSFVGNELSLQRFELGKRLFFDTQLSSDNSVSCASCHAQVHAFADHNVALSSGVEGRLGQRNASSIANLAWSPSFMWDGGVNHLEVFSVAPITDTNEMNETMQNVVAKLNADPSYVKQFKQAYQVGEVNDQILLKALTLYMVMIVSDQSKYDKWVRGKASLSAEEDAGRLVFEQKCATCHSGALQTDFSFRNNGLDSVFVDLGRGRITNNPNDYGKFKVPSLRNVALTYPYMHDGRIQSLEAVLDHYASGIVSSPTLDPSLSNGISLTAIEKAQIIAFLKTLTDYKLLDKMWLNE
ncbi:MAG: cytochrome-c peroxidase [Fluviicola sp.]